jgi:uncharacterized protein (DUF362 family)
LSLISLTKIKNSNITKAIEESLNLISYEFPINIKNVVIKPNLCYYWDYSTGQTTDPKFIAALINLIRNKTSSTTNISILESDASAMKCKYAFKMLGYERLARNYNVKLVNLSEDSCSPVYVTINQIKFRFLVPKTIQDADLKMNVPKIKYTMRGIELTCALKNIYGCNPYPKKFRYHQMLAETIVALNKIMRFDLHIVDGNIVSGIQPRKLGLVMASRNPVAIDAATAEIAGLNPRRIKYLQLAEKEGIGKISYIPRGVPINYFKTRYPRKDFKKKLMGKAYAALLLTRLGEKLGIQ